MIFLAATLRPTRRPRRVPTVASLVRAFGTVRISDQPEGLWSSVPRAADPAHSSTNQARDVRRRDEGPDATS